MLFEKNPSSETKIISQIFKKTVATYKYYWFVSILDIVVKEKRRQISFWEIIVGMIVEAWYPIHYFRLSFGKSDSLYMQIIEIQKELNIPIDAKKSHIKSYSKQYKQSQNRKHFPCTYTFDTTLQR